MVADGPKIVRKRLEEAQVRRTMASAESKAWNDWGRGLAAKEARLQCEALSAAICDTLGKRIADLEAEVARLKGMAPEREEWPLRTIQGGKR